jgi:hypothetical protein
MPGSKIKRHTHHKELQFGLEYGKALRMSKTAEAKMRSGLKSFLDLLLQPIVPTLVLTV